MMLKRILYVGIFVLVSLINPAYGAKNILGAVPFIHKPFQKNDFVKVDDQIVKNALSADIQMVPFDFKYSMDELEEAWPTLMRGLRAPFPSEDYVKTIYQRYPDLYADVKTANADWKTLSEQVKEVWWLFAKGDLQKAIQKADEYGGLVRVPAMYAEMTLGTYYTTTIEQKQHVLQDAANQVAFVARLMDYKKNEEKYPEDFLPLRVVYAYSMGRGIEDASIPRLLVSSAPFQVIDAVNAILKVDPDHTLGLALQGSIDSNVIRRMGRVGAKLATFADSKDAIKNYERALKNVGDMAMLRTEFANTLIYIGGKDALRQAALNLLIASQTPSHIAMEELDRLFASKRLKEIKALDGSEVSFKKFDKERIGYIRKSGINYMSINEPPFLLTPDKS